MNENTIKIDLDLPDLVELESLDIIKRKGLTCKITDFCRNTGFYYNDYNVKRYNYYYTKSQDGDDTKPRVISGREGFTYNCALANIRPIFKSKELYDLLCKDIIGDEVEFGYYPQSKVNFLTSNIQYLERNSGKLNQTGNKYKVYFKFGYKRYLMDMLEYEYNNKRYVSYKNGDNFFKVEPVKWLVDKDTYTFISKKILLGGIPLFTNGDPFHGECYSCSWHYSYAESFYDVSSIKRFFETYLVNEIFGSSLNKLKTTVYIDDDEVNNKLKTARYIDDEKINNKLIEIYERTEKTSNEYEIKSYMTKLINEYNANLDKIKNNLNNRNTLSFDTYTVDTLKRKIMLDLDNIITKLDDYDNNNLEYKKMIELIDASLDTSINVSYLDDDASSFINDIRNIINISIPFLKQDDKENLKDKTTDILLLEKIRINDYLKTLIRFDNTQSNKTLKYHTLSEFIMELRRLIHPILEEISIKVNEREIEKEIHDTLISIMDTNYDIPKNRFLGMFLGLINESYNSIISNIDSLPDNIKNSYLDNINLIMDTNIDYTKDFNEICNVLKKMWTELNKIMYEIEDYVTELEQIRSSYIRK